MGITNQRKFLIVAPRFTHKSAGVVTLYKLAEELGGLGHDVYVISPLTKRKKNLGYEQLSFFGFILKWRMLRNGTVIYHESIQGNPLQIKYPVRYLLNVPGSVRSPRYSFIEGQVWSYSQEIAIQSGYDQDKILYIPVSDPNFFKDDGTKRSQIPLVYSGKFDVPHSELPKNSKLITRTGKNSPTREEYRKLLQSHEEIHVWENTAVALEAVLSGCICIFHLNSTFTKPFALRELSASGYAYFDDPKSIDLAKETIKHARTEYLKRVSETRIRIIDFVRTTKDVSPNTISFVNIRPPLLSGLIGRMYSKVREGGVPALALHLKLAVYSRKKR